MAARQYSREAVLRLLTQLDSTAGDAVTGHQIAAAAGIERDEAPELLSQVFDCTLDELVRCRDVTYSPEPDFAASGNSSGASDRPDALRLSDSARAEQGLNLGWGIADGWFGPCLLGWTDYGLCWLDLDPEPDSEVALRELWQVERLSRDDQAARRIARQVFDPAQSPPALHLRGTPFQLRTWRTLLAIPAAVTVTYAGLAARLGLGSQASRAIGGAVAANRVAVAVPCHRVVPAAGGIGGFRWGPLRKGALLQREAAQAGRRPSRHAA